MEIRFVARAALVIVIAATLLLGPLGQVDGRAAGSMDVVPRTATAPLDAVTLSGGGPGQQIGDPAEQGSETYVVYPTMLRVTLVGQQGFSQDIALENGQFSGETFDLPEGLPPGDYEFSAQLLPEPSDSQAADVHFTPCDPTATLAILPPDVRATLNLDPERGDVGDSVTATGTCPTSNETTEVRFDDAVVGTATVNVSTGVISPVNLSVPDVHPGPHAVSTSCGGRAPFEVPPPPSVPATLLLEPASGVVGAAVTATGTCPVSSKVVRVYFGEESAGSAAVDPRTGQFGPVQFTVPNDGLGPVTVRTDCDARQ